VGSALREIWNANGENLVEQGIDDGTPDQSIPSSMDSIKINRLLLIGKGEFLRGRGQDITAIAWVLR